MARQPLIGCTAYRKTADQNPPIELYGAATVYTEAVRRAGGIPLLIPLGLNEAELAQIIERVDGLMLPGGGDIEPALYQGAMDTTMWGIDRERDRTELYLTRQVVSHKKPILAICRGIQVLNVALGGSLWGDVASQMPKAIRHDYFRTYPRNRLSHTVEINDDSLLAGCLGQKQVWVNSLHHQGIRELGQGLRITALAPDGLIEGVEVAGHPFAVGIQWHPECLVDDDPAMLSLFKGLVAASRQSPA